MTSSEEENSDSTAAPVLAIDGELTIGSLALFRTRVFAALSEAKALKISLGNATYLDAAALQHLWALRLEGEQRGIAITIEEPPPAIRQDAEELGMQAVFAATLHPSGSRDD